MLLEFRDIHVNFGGVNALDSVSLTMGEGQIVGLIGPNGAGKSTLLNVASGLVSPQGGSVLLNGGDLRGKGPEPRARAGLARTLQGVSLFEGLTLRENLLVTARLGGIGGRPIRAQVPTASDRVFAAAEFLGIEAELDSAVTDLPGDRQRLADLAAALCLRPRCLLLDEPAAGSGRQGAEALAERLRAIRDRLGISILLVEHDVRLVLGVADVIHVLDRGSVIASGTPAEIRQNPLVIAAYLGHRDADVDEVGHAAS